MQFLINVFHARYRWSYRLFLGPYAISLGLGRSFVTC